MSLPVLGSAPGKRLGGKPAVSLRDLLPLGRIDAIRFAALGHRNG